MNRKEKAKELVEKMYKVHSNSVSEITMFFAKQCALIAVEREIKLINEIMDNYHGYQDLRTPVKLFKDVLNPLLKEKQEIKTEIEKL